MSRFPALPASALLPLLLLAACGGEPSADPAPRVSPADSPASRVAWDPEALAPRPGEFTPEPGSGDSWIEGVVVDGEGAPVPGATVEMHAVPHPGLPGVLILHSSTKAGPDGRFRAGPGPEPWVEFGLLSAVAPGFARTSLRSSRIVLPGLPSADPGGEARIVLRPAIPLKGEVRGEDGGPPDGPVTVWAMGEREFSEVVVTDASGAFTMQVPAGKVFLLAVDGLHPKSRAEVEARPGEEVSVRIPVLRGRDIRGTVVDATTGGPIAGAAIRAYYGTTRIFRSAEDGSFLLPRYWFQYFQVRAPGFATRVHHLASEARIGVPHPETVRLLPGFVARGKVTDFDGRPLAGMRLRTFGKDPGDSWLDIAGPVSAEDGTFTFVGMPSPSEGREVRVFSIHRGFAFGSSKDLHGRPGEVVDGVLVRVPRLVTVEGRVEDEHGNPHAAALELEWDPGEGIGAYEGMVPSRSRTGSGDDGRWQARLPERTRLRVRATGSAFEPGELEATTPAHPDSLPDPSRPAPGPFVVRVHRGLTVAGSVVDSSGRPVPRGEVRVEPHPLGDPRPSRDAALGADGTFEAGGLPPGLYDLSILSHPEFLQEVRFRVEAGSDPLRVVLRRPGSLRGRVLAPEGTGPTALATVEVRALGDSRPLPGHLGVRVLLSEGNFHFSPLAPGAYSLSVVAGDLRCDVGSVEVGEGAPTELGDIALGGAGVVAGVVRSGGRALAGARLEVLRLLPDGRYESLRRAETGADGTFRIGGLTPGPSFLAVHPRDHTLLTLPFDAVAGEVAEVEAVVPPGVALRVRVLDPSGAPAAGARVLVSRDGEGLLFWREGSGDPPPHATGPDGLLTCTGLPPGDLRVVAELPGTGGGEALVEAPGPGPASVEIRLQPR